jgi:hypothetical protein
MEKFTCLVADLALIFKLRTFYPRPTFTGIQQLLRISPLLILTPPRVIVICLTIVALIRDREEYAIKMGIVDFAIQIVYCSYASGESVAALGSRPL